MDEALGHGYEAFLERLVSDFKASSDVSTKGSPNPFNISSSASPSSSSSSLTTTATMMMMNDLDMDCRQSKQEVGSISEMDLAAPHRRGCHHRRAHSEMAFRFPDDFLEASAISDETSDDLFSMYVDMDKIHSHAVNSASMPDTPSTSSSDRIAPPSTSTASHHTRSASLDRGTGMNAITGYGSGSSPSGMLTTATAGRPSRARHHHSLSMDGGSMLQDLVLLSPSELFDAKKAMPADKLAELAVMDPKRAKRILANRQSAARSKERKVRYISELERRVQTLQAEACTLSAQITMLQRDTSDLTTQNSELRLRLQCMEEQAQLRDALSDALREEIKRLKVVTNMSNGGTMPAGSSLIPSLQQQQDYGFVAQPPPRKGHSPPPASASASASASLSPSDIMIE